MNQRQRQLGGPLFTADAGFQDTGFGFLGQRNVQHLRCKPRRLLSYNTKNLWIVNGSEESNSIISEDHQYSPALRTWILKHLAISETSIKLKFDELCRLLIGTVCIDSK